MSVSVDVHSRQVPCKAMGIPFVDGDADSVAVALFVECERQRLGLMFMNPFRRLCQHFFQLHVAGKQRFHARPFVSLTLSAFSGVV